MHGCSSGSAFLINAEVDSMGGVVDGGVGIVLKTSPRRVAIERAQAKLRQENDVREERRRQLEFLEKGGNPLDFKFGNGRPVSVQSTSLTYQHPEQFVISEAKGSFALTSSPHGDSIESSGRPGGQTVFEPSSADNLLLFEGDNELPEGERNPRHPSTRKNIVPSEQSSQLDGRKNNKATEDSAIFRPYARRDRSRPNRDGARSSSTNILQSHGGPGSALPARGGSKDLNVSLPGTRKPRDKNIPLVSDTKSMDSNGDMTSNNLTSDDQLDMNLDGIQPPYKTNSLIKGNSTENKLDNSSFGSARDYNNIRLCGVTTQEASLDVAKETNLVVKRDQSFLESIQHPPCVATNTVENKTSSSQLNGSSDLKRDSEIPNGSQNRNAALGTKGLDSESSLPQSNVGLDVNNDIKMSCDTKEVGSAGKSVEQNSSLEQTIQLVGTETIKEKNDTVAFDSGVLSSISESHSNNGAPIKYETDIHINGSGLHSKVNHTSPIGGVQPNDHIETGTIGKGGNLLGEDSNQHKENLSVRSRSLGASGHSHHQLPESTCSRKDSASASTQASSGNDFKLAEKAHEDSILEEGRTIEVKWKRIAELSIYTLPLENRQRSHWDYVLEEMAWLANDFAQERLWKITAAGQMCQQAAFASHLRLKQKDQVLKLKEVAHILAKAVMQFWQSAEVILDGNDPDACPRHQNDDLDGSRKNSNNEVSKDKIEDDKNEAFQDKIGEPITEICRELEQQNPKKGHPRAVQGYAVRFLKYNSSLGPQHAEAPLISDRISDSGILDMSRTDRLTEESLFYTVPLGAMDVYRKSIESHLAQCEKVGNSMLGEVETSMHDTVAEFGHLENVDDEGEGESSTYYLPGAFLGSKSSKFAHQKRKNLVKSYAGGSYVVATALAYGHCEPGTQQPLLMGKRPASGNVGPNPIKRMRTASRQRIIGPFTTEVYGVVQAQAKTNASSGDTNSFQDDTSTLLGGSQTQKSSEVESVRNLEKQLPLDYADTSIKFKKKNTKHPGSMHDKKWQLESTIVNEQRVNSKRRLENHNFESNGESGLYGQHNSKKLKIMRPSLDNTLENINPVTKFVPSPVASQISNMFNTNRFIKLIGGRDRGRKAKALKISVAQSGSGNPWSLFEDQALVVLVHDMGPNWELVSDAINSTLQFKCIYRNPKECKDRHKILMDNSDGDGADSAEDSGSSQPYPSMLPGIPKGTARQLFQRLQEPMEEDTLKSHFKKIIKIGQKPHYCRSQNGNLDPKQRAPVHNSHVMALSEVCPNNLNGCVLTPLELCDALALASNPDVSSLGYQNPRSSGLSIPNQGILASAVPNSCASSSLQGSASMVMESNLSKTSGSLNSFIRDGKYGVARTPSLPVDEQQKMQRYNLMLAGRNIQQPKLSVSGNLPGNERDGRMLPGGNGMGMTCGANRNMPISRPGFHGMASAPMLNSGCMRSSSSSVVGGMPTPVNMLSGACSGQGNSMFRPREALHIMRPGHSPEHETQVTQGNSQGNLNSLSSAFPNQAIPPSIQTYAGHNQSQNQISQQQSHAVGSPRHPLCQASYHHAPGSQQQANAIRLAKERQLQQQRYLQQQQQQFASSNAFMPHVQTSQPQLPVSSPMQNSPHLQQRTSSSQVSLPSLTPSSPMSPISLKHQQKHHMPPHALSGSPDTRGLNNQVGKSRPKQAQQQHQQFQQSGRHHPQQQQQQPQYQQQAKLLKGVARGNLNGLSVPPPGNQTVEKEEQTGQLMPSQGVYPWCGLSTVQQSKPLVSQSSNCSQVQQKLHCSSAPPSPKPVKQMPSHSDNSPRGQVPPCPPLSALDYQAVPSGVMASPHQALHLQPQPPQKQVNQTQSNCQRTVQQNCKTKAQTGLAQADLQPVDNVSQGGSNIALTQVVVDSTSVVTTVVSSAAASQSKRSEIVNDSNMPSSTTQLGLIESPPLTYSAGNEPLLISQGLGPRQ